MKKIISILTFAGLVLGVLLGLFFPQFAASAEFIGIWYLKILKAFIAPVIFTGISVTAYKTAGRKDRLVLKSVALFSAMFTASFLIASALVLLIDPAKDFVFEQAGSTALAAGELFPGIEMLLRLFPVNLSDIFVSPKVFGIIVIAWVFGRAGSLIKKSGGVFSAMEKARDFFYKVLEYFMYLTPAAVFSLTASTVSRYGSALLGAGLKYIGTAYACSLAVIALVMILPVRIFAGIGPLEYIRKVYRIWIMTMTTCSSAATLPYTIRLCRDEFGIPGEVTDVVVPLGCTIHMCGGAVSFALLGLFCTLGYGISIGFGKYMMMLLAALLINMAAPGIPGGGIVIGASYLQLLGIPLGFMGFYAGIYKILDMVYTTLNVTGDISANILLGKKNTSNDRRNER
ncbi:MAG: cation:dicarboxylase symporter family transporter [Firmicutes bacterium]|nr:cation:dicarboxylase symporter family transporter [Bacillota bacterium]